jgi:hypothetical protein
MISAELSTDFDGDLMSCVMERVLRALGAKEVAFTISPGTATGYSCPWR